MGTYIHIAEVATLLFVAYFVGWLIGYVARRIAAGAPQAKAAIPAARLAAATSEPADALVRAPIVVPVNDAPPPPVPAMATQIEPVKARVTADGAVLVEPPATPTSEPVSGIDTLKALSATMPLMPAEAASAVAEKAEPAEPQQPAVKIAPVATTPEVVQSRVEQLESEIETVTVPEAPEPVAEPSAPSAAAPAVVIPEVVVDAPMAQLEAPPEPPAPEPAPIAGPLPPPMPASVPGVAWSGAINGHAAEKFEAPAIAVARQQAEARPDPAGSAFAPAPLHDDLPPAALDQPDDEPSAGLDVALLGSLAEQLKIDDPAVAPPRPDVPAEPVAPPRATAPAKPELAPVAVAVQPAPQPAAEPAHVEFDESAAMRAIEGGWSRKAARALPDAPEMTDVSAAVSAAQIAVEQVLALNGLDAAEAENRAQAAFGKPRGLGKPRDGGRDDLKQINGLSPLDELTLNNLGIFHFDQIAAWDEREVLWMENHAFARGRIGRERWQSQARELQGRGGDTARAARSRMPL